MARGNGRRGSGEGQQRVALPTLATRESMALLVAVHARMREPAGTRARQAAVMKDDLPVPGGPCTTDTAPRSPLSAARCPGLSRASWACCMGSLGSRGRHGSSLAASAEARAAAEAEVVLATKAAAMPGSSL